MPPPRCIAVAGCVWFCSGCAVRAGAWLLPSAGWLRAAEGALTALAAQGSAAAPAPARVVGPRFARGARPELGGHGRAPCTAAVGSAPWPGQQTAGPGWGEGTWFGGLAAERSCL